MKVIMFILQKEFRQIFRNKGMLPIIFIMPIVQLLVLVHAADFEIKNIRIAVIDNDHSQASNSLINKIASSGRFVYSGSFQNYKAGMEELDKNDVDVVLQIPNLFSHLLATQDKIYVGVELNGIDGQSAGLTAFYLQSIIGSYNKKVVLDKFKIVGDVHQPITVEEMYWYNPLLNYKIYMVPGLLVVLVTMIGLFLSSMNIVKEKEFGTIEQVNVSPIKKHQFIIGKLFPFWVIGIFELFFGLLLGYLIYDVPIRGSITALFSFTAIYLIAIMGIGLFVSTLTTTQQQAMFVSWFFMVIFILMSGLFTPLENMPYWAQYINWFNPVAYFIEVIRLILLKGSGFAEIQNSFLVIFLFAIISNLLAMLNYHKRA